MIDDDVHQRVKPTRLTRILDQYREQTTAGDGNGERRSMTQMIANAKELTALATPPRGEGPTVGRGPQADPHLHGASCIASGALKVQGGHGEGARRPPLQDRVSIVGTGCLGPCSAGPP